MPFLLQFDDLLGVFQHIRNENAGPSRKPRRLAFRRSATKASLSPADYFGTKPLRLPTSERGCVLTDSLLTESNHLMAVLRKHERMPGQKRIALCYCAVSGVVLQKYNREVTLEPLLLLDRQIHI